MEPSKDGWILAIDRTISSLRPRIPYLGLSAVGMHELRSALDQLRQHVDQGAAHDSLSLDELRHIQRELCAIPVLLDKLIEHGALAILEPTIFAAWVKHLTKKPDPCPAPTTFDLRSVLKA